MIKLNKKNMRAVLTLFLGALFVASAFIFNSDDGTDADRREHHHV